MLLDPRIQRQRYGRVFLESLPPYRVTQDIAAVESFFNAADEDLSARAPA
jgi:ATP-dependent DNA helicase DinG